MSTIGLVLVAGCASPLSPTRAEDPAVAEGRDLFETHCELCHGAEARGNGPISDDLKVHPADLTKIAARRAGTFPEAEVAGIIDGRTRVRGHGREMPVWGRALAEETADPAKRPAAVKEKIAKLVAYLRSIQVPD
jgi:mono/diheme cytochrome c family protein